MKYQELVAGIMEIGLSENEARAYLALLETHPSTGYEIAKQSGIPSSKVYEVLRKLSSRGMILELEEKGKTRYIPQEGTEFVSQTREKLSDTLSNLEKGLASFGKVSNTAYIWSFDDYMSCIEKALSIIDNAEETVLISLWEEDYPYFESILKKVDSRVRVSVVLFGDSHSDIGLTRGACFLHPIRDTLYQEKGGRGLVVVADGREAFMGTFYGVSFDEKGGQGAESAEGAWSRNPGFTTLAEDYIKHDVYIMKIVQRFEKELKTTYGSGYELLRDVFSNRTKTK